MHTVYVPADRYDAGTVRDWGEQAGRAGRHAPRLPSWRRPPDCPRRWRRGPRPGRWRKLAPEPIEDLRIDFEDGYGRRPDDEEDAAAVAAARALAASVATGTAAPFHGIRFKSFEAPTRRRGLRTLDLFLGELAGDGALTDGFVVTLPKVTSVDQVEAMVARSASGSRRRTGCAAGRCASRSRSRPRRRPRRRTGRRSSPG